MNFIYGIFRFIEWGIILTVALWLANVALGLLFAFIALVYVGISALWNKIFGE